VTTSKIWSGTTGCRQRRLWRKNLYRSHGFEEDEVAMGKLIENREPGADSVNR